MPKGIERYELSALAEEDLGKIYDYTVSEFGR
jgi:plasmid stabilization system protein ParE